MRKVALYVRHSTDQQEGSTVSQIDELQRYCVQNNREVVRIFEDRAQSGTSFLKRPAFLEMLKLVESGKAGFDEVLVYDESRWGRGVNPRENSYWKVHFERFGVVVNVIHSRSSGGNDVGSYVIEVVESAEASEYSKKLSRATLRGAKDNARKGFSSGGSAPYGLKRVAVNKFTGHRTRDLQLGEHINEDEKCVWDLGDPTEISIVERIFEMKIKGMGDVPIADVLNREGVPPPKRGRWKNKDQKWCGGAVRVILTNPCYCGTRIYNRHPQSHLAGPDKEVWFNPKEEWVITENAHPAIVSKETFEMANQDRKDYKRKNRYFYSSPYLLSGLVVCSYCGFNFQGQNHSQKKMRHYEDSGYISKGKSVCTSYKINAVKLEAFVIKAIRTKILNSDLPKRLEEMLDGNIKHRSFERLENVEQLEKALSDNKTRMERLFTLYETGTAIEQIADRIKGLEKEKKAFEQELEKAKLSNMSRKEIFAAKASVQYLMDNFEVTLKYAPVHAQKELLRKFVQRIVVDRPSDSIIVYLKRVPSVNNASTASASGVLGCVEVRMKTNRKSKLADKSKQTEAAIETNKETIVLTQN